jgi:TIR domain
MNRVFISHTHGDQPIADALSDLLTSLFGDTFNINYSSKEELKGGIAPGEDWQRWIDTQVKDTDVALLVLTPNSIQKPWVLWEAGAVAGAIAARVTDDRARKIYPVVYELKSNEIPDPFRRLQVVLGTDQKEMTKLVEDLTNLVEDDFSRADMRKIGVKMGECILTYLTTMKEVVLKLPLVVTEDFRNGCPDLVNSKKRDDSLRLEC